MTDSLKPATHIHNIHLGLRCFARDAEGIRTCEDMTHWSSYDGCVLATCPLYAPRDLTLFAARPVVTEDVNCDCGYYSCTH